MIAVVVSVIIACASSINIQSLQPASVTNRSSAPVSSAKVITYTIQARGSISSSIEEFRSQVAQTLSDSRGWVRAGISFQEVSSGGRFTIALSSPAEVKAAYPSVCSETLSCSVGNLVLINDDRWRLATDTWTNAGGSIRDYRHMVINHEVGHSLGHGHVGCPAAGSPAPIMRQQSVDLGGCTINPWPLNSELWHN